MTPLEALDQAIDTVRQDIRDLKFSKVYALSLPEPVSRLDTLEFIRETLEGLREVLAETQPVDMPTRNLAQEAFDRGYFAGYGVTHP